ncbi:MAG: extracellular solute-binding protein, partial [Gemmataceae bacterium]
TVTRRHALAGLAGLAGLALSGCGTRPRVVLYCAQDRGFAEGVLADFTAQAGVDVAPKFDTEANKSVGLYHEVVAEAGRPRGDVFWNNEILNTIRLHRQGLLEPHASPAAAAYPAWARAEDHAWHAFAGRARVLIVNTRLIAEGDRPAGVFDLAQARYRDRVVMAKPLFGTTAAHAASLFQVLGDARARAFFTALKGNGVQIAPGNKQVAEWVGRGRTPAGQPAAVGVTDTDDAIDEVRAGRDVAIVFPDAGGGMGTLFIPNTLMLIRGAPNAERGRRLIDFLLGPGVEKRLAEGPGAQIPLNPGGVAELPAAIAAGRDAAPMRVDWVRAADAWDGSQAFLAREFGG